MKIGEEVLERISRLAQLELSARERKSTAEELEEMMASLDVLKKLTPGPEDGRMDLEGVLREDEPAPSMLREELMSNAPAADGESFLAPYRAE